MGDKMTLEEIRAYLKDKTYDEKRNFIIDKLKEICDEAERLSVNEENYELAKVMLDTKNRLKNESNENDK